MEAKPIAEAMRSILGWRELGWVGRGALVGMVASVGLAVWLGFSIPALARVHLLSAQADLIESTAQDVITSGLFDDGLDNPAATAELDKQLRLRLISGETVRVKLWDLDGTIVYSDAPELIGKRFPLTAPARSALAGVPSHFVSDLSDPAHSLDRDLGEVIEFYNPITNESGAVLGALELELDAAGLASTLGHIQRNVWLSITFGIGALAVFMASLFVAGARVLNRRRRQAEALLGESLRAREEERRRIAGALHGDLGQPLYRVLFRIEGLRARAEDPEVVESELENIGNLVREVDRSLRAELKLLHHSAVDEVGLAAVLDELAETVRVEAGLPVSLHVDVPDDFRGTPASALSWAAEEALINVRKHASAHQVEVRAHWTGKDVVLEVIDDGVGVSAPRGLGLTTTRERLEAIGGALTVHKRRGGGTWFNASVPWSGIR